MLQLFEGSLVSMLVFFLLLVGLVGLGWRSSSWRQRAQHSEVRLHTLEAAHKSLQQELRHSQDQYQHGSQQYAALGAQKQSAVERLAESRERVVFLEKRLQTVQQDAASAERKLAELRVTHEERQQAYIRLEQGLLEQKKAMQLEFENLANQIVEAKQRQIQTTSKQSFEQLLQPFREQISQFQQRVDHVHEQSLKSYGHLSSEIKQMLEVGLQMSNEANNLTTALKGDKKLTGMWGELQLERTLSAAGLVKGEHYLSQAMFRDEADERRYPDFVVLLPDNKHIVVDSKASLVAYEQAVNAEDAAEQERLLNVHVLAMQQHIDDLAKKRYDQLKGLGSPDFVFMFVPIEGAYIEAMRHKPRLFEYGVKRNVMVVSHTSLLPVLRTVANVWMLARSNEQAHELGIKAAELHDQVALLAERLRRMGDSINQLNQNYSKVVTATAGRQGLYGKVQRFKELSARTTRDLPELDFTPHEVTAEHARLEQVEPPAEHETAESIAANQ